MTRNLSITADQIARWKGEAAVIKEKISSLRDEERRLDELIHAANLLAEYGDSQTTTSPETKPEQPRRYVFQRDDDTPKPTPPSIPDEGPTLVDAILMALRAAGKPQSNKEIKAKLGGTGFNVSRLKSSPNYFYTATKRLVDRGLIEKMGDGRYSLVKESAPDEESLFGSSPGASNHTGSNQSGEPHAQGREAVPGGGP
ncbi:hypothetical protein AAFO92_08095 [Roseovarius sp. CAU 1744]|uniref:hypothetical protein n=1 Tax=Roseovarius sp. CAU 1744 TaxID=3140368 RepID=UPI00325BA955